MTDIEILISCNEYAKKHSTCCKAQVGAFIYREPLCVSKGCNIAMPDNCKEVGCHRLKIYGENSKQHRLPSDCYALHAEINALSTYARMGGKGLYGATMYVSRYPCEACARAIVAAGITKVIYGGIEEISEQTAKIFKLGNVQTEFMRIVWGGDVIE